MHTQAHHTSPLVSVIVPAYNASAYIEETMRSVMAQTMTDWELIVIDDCSSDGTFGIAEIVSSTDSRIRVYRNEQNSGVSRTRNRGLDLARGMFIAFLDSDDIWYPEKLERQIGRLNQTGAQICCSSYEIIDASGTNTRADIIVPEQLDLNLLLKENVILCSSLLIRSEALRDTRFTTAFYHEDYAFELQLLRQGCRAVGCREPLVKWRYIANSRSFNKWNSAKNRWKIYRDYLHLPLGKSAYYFIHYTCAGLRKYLRRC